ncbi:hypothetical protein GQ53DRAFT_822772 [Thozetella sp. PMI_491]|nr:hypothetical protein GQ53DRAFT_822772 [Thozetella sp. PMI_491]
MADPLSVTASLIAIVGATIQTSITLYNEIQGFRNHPPAVRRLGEELDALNTVLQSLRNHVDDDDDPTLAALKRPLLQCQKECAEFQVLVVRCNAHSNDSRTSWRDWARLRYMRADVNSFTDMLNGYKSTITIALSDATFRTTGATMKMLRDHHDLIESTTSDLTHHLEDINQRLVTLTTQPRADTVDIPVEIRRMTEERDSAQICLEICTKVSTYIQDIRFRPIRSETPPIVSPTLTGLSSQDLTTPEVITLSALKGCTDTVAAAASDIKKYAKDTVGRLQEEAVEGHEQVTASDHQAEVERLEGERESLEQRLAFCTDASIREHVVEDLSIGDEGQQMVISTKDFHVLRLKNLSAGKKAVQLIAVTSDESFRHLIQHQLRK